MNDKDTKIWERQPSESAKAFSAFNTYMLLPLRDENPENKRSLLNVSRKLGYALRMGTHSSTQIEIWSSKNDWVERAGAYDAHMAIRNIVVIEKSLEGFQQAVVENATVQIAAINRVIQQKINAMLDAQSKGDSVDALDIVRVASAAKTMDDLARRVGKMATSYKTEEVKDTPDDGQVFIIGANDG